MPGGGVRGVLQVLNPGLAVEEVVVAEDARAGRDEVGMGVEAAVQKSRDDATAREAGIRADAVRHGQGCSSTGIHDRLGAAAHGGLWPSVFSGPWKRITFALGDMTQPLKLCLVDMNNGVPNEAVRCFRRLYD